MGFNEEYNRMSFLVIISVAGRKILGAGKPRLFMVDFPLPSGLPEGRCW